MSGKLLDRKIVMNILRIVNQQKINNHFYPQKQKSKTSKGVPGRNTTTMTGERKSSRKKNQTERPERTATPNLRKNRMGMTTRQTEELKRRMRTTNKFFLNFLGLFH